MSILQKYDHLIFDLDGVLIDSSPCHQNAYQKLWNELDIIGPEYEEIAGKRTVEVVSSLTQSLLLSEQEINDWVRFKQEEARDEMQHSLRVFPYAAKIIKQLYSNGWKMSVATGASKESALLALDKMDITDYFNTIVTANDVTRGKPDPMVFTKAINTTTVAPENCLVIEDSLAGVEAAIAAGSQVCTIHTGIKSDSALFVGAFADLDSALTQLEVLK